MKRTITYLVALAALAALAGCDDKNGDDGQDTVTDTGLTDTVVEDTTVTDTVVEDTTVEDTVVEDSMEDTEDASELPATCDGPDTLTLEFLYPDDSPVVGVAVALKCLDEVRTAPSGPGGQVTFSNLDLASQPVDFTYVNGGKAFTLLGVGGTRTPPDPFTFYLDDPEATEEPDPVPMVGDIVRSTAGSWVAVATVAPHWMEFKGDRYEIYTPDTTGLTLTAIEYTSDGDTATALGYLIVDYDTPAEGTDGPTLDFTSPDGTLADASLTLDHDLVMDSPLTSIVMPHDSAGTSNRLDVGMRLVGYDDAGDFLMYGFTTSWTGDFTTDTLHMAYIAEGVTGSSSISGELIYEDPARNYLYVHTLATDPATWTDLTIHDLPQLAGFSSTTPVTFGTEIPVAFPEWTDAAMQYYIREDGYWGVLSYSDELRWNVIVHPETTSFTFGDLPFPDTLTYDDVLGPGSYHFGAVEAHYDADPYESYNMWDGEWADTHWLGFGNDSRFRMAVP